MVVPMSATLHLNEVPAVTPTIKEIGDFLVLHLGEDVYGGVDVLANRAQLQQIEETIHQFLNPAQTGLPEKARALALADTEINAHIAKCEVCVAQAGVFCEQADEINRRWEQARNEVLEIVGTAATAS